MTSSVTVQQRDFISLILSLRTVTDNWGEFCRNLGSDCFSSGRAVSPEPILSVPTANPVLAAATVDFTDKGSATLAPCELWDESRLSQPLSDIGCRLNTHALLLLFFLSFLFPPPTSSLWEALHTFGVASSFMRADRRDVDASEDYTKAGAAVVIVIRSFLSISFFLSFFH